MVVAALLLVGVGTTVLTAVNARADTEADLRETVESLSELLTELTIVPDASETGRDIRARLQTLADSLSVDGIGILVSLATAIRSAAFPKASRSRTSTPTCFEPARRRATGMATSSGQRGNVSRNGTRQLVVMTDEPDPLLMPSFRWFCWPRWRPSSSPRSSQDAQPVAHRTHPGIP